MTYKDILDLAYTAALEAWYREWEILQKDPTNELCKMWERNAWDRAETLRLMLMEEIEKNPA